MGKQVEECERERVRYDEREREKERAKEREKDEETGRTKKKSAYTPVKLFVSVYNAFQRVRTASITRERAEN